MPTYAELSKPAADEVADVPTPRISNWKAYIGEQLKWELIIKGPLLALGLLIYLAASFLFGSIEKAGKEELAHEMRDLAQRCKNPAERAALERNGWTVRANADGSCRLQRRM